MPARTHGRTRMKAVNRAGSVLSASPHRQSSADTACQCRNPCSDDTDTNNTNDSCTSPNSSVYSTTNSTAPPSHEHRRVSRIVRSSCGHCVCVRLGVRELESTLAAGWAVGSRGARGGCNYKTSPAYTRYKEARKQILLRSKIVES